ncbi:hypothetical protein [Leptospira borgpetersenii]|uniref:hypothetical protein n=1 Tax=Leptospira borgpetersenii TaxID=174 RepID=UPI0018806F35|nr:hypothetical protein [Leptospira borgpetersenii]MBE8374744.1 hypothetical protein [Leptospira borgpetersenii serovar Hardjo-bovis]MBE8383867.1 hypothetical protein [Leptospira borgpetersenii serovar Hardjo-bovis]
MVIKERKTWIEEELAGCDFGDIRLHKIFRQNGAPSGLEKRGLYASIYHKTRKPTEGTQ